MFVVLLIAEILLLSKVRIFFQNFRYEFRKKNGSKTENYDIHKLFFMAEINRIYGKYIKIYLLDFSNMLQY